MTDVSWRDITCPRCAAPPHRRCRSGLGKSIANAHLERREEALREQSKTRLLLGVCPVCVSEEDLDDDGRIAPHKQVLGLARTDVDCPGAGHLPEVDA